MRLQTLERLGTRLVGILAGICLLVNASGFAGQGGAQGSGVNRAGEVINAIPDDVVRRLGKGSPLPLNVSDPVNWEDVVRTLNTGRVRIRLLDGSFLNVGARSTMQVVRHDPQTEQTQIELALGRLRGEVKKLSKAGASFEIETPTAVIGVVGTIFDVVATKTATHVIVLKGSVRVRNKNRKVKGEVIVREGQETHVKRHKPPEPPTRMRQTEKEMYEEEKTSEERKGEKKGEASGKKHSASKRPKHRI